MRRVDALHATLKRIRAPAARRLGELLVEHKARPGDRHRGLLLDLGGVLTTDFYGALRAFVSVRDCLLMLSSRR